MSRIEESLLLRIQSSSIERERAVLSSRLAIYYFHKGESERAIDVVEKVRAWLRLNDGLDVMVYINLAEATDQFQSANTQEAIQKAKRAYALSAASR
jgi:tetratricopeptide (TPR) repeat protein